MRYANLHTHSTFSDGKFSLEENVLSAMEKNMCALGFSDHSFTPCDTSYCMKTEDYDAYLGEISRLKEKYAGKIDLYAGIELDYDSDPDTSRFDYTIASVHYIVKNGVTYPIDHTLQQQQTCAAEVFGGDKLTMAKCYYDQVTEHVKRCKPILVGHFDVITKFGFMPEEDPAYREIALNALKEVLPVCPYIELNTGAISRKCRTTPYPARYLLEELLHTDAKLVLGSDSHHKDNLIFWFDEAVALAKEVGFREIYRYNGKGYDAIQI